MVLCICNDYDDMVTLTWNSKKKKESDGNGVEHIHISQKYRDEDFLKHLRREEKRKRCVFMDRSPN